MPQSDTLHENQRLGPYRIERLVGRGGMGYVYRAFDTRLDRTVAIKVLSPELAHDAAFRDRFEREAKSIATLNHPHICTLHDIGRQGEIDYLVIEYLEGQTLADRLSKGRLPLDEALRYGVQITDALARAHREGIVHRDLKPANVMLTRAGVKLLDFGLAKTTAGRGPDASLSLARTEADTQGMVMGTPHYMAPEQLEGHPADPRTDIFASGIVLYEMLTGVKPFTGRSHAHLAAAILEHQPEPVTAHRPETPPVVARAVAKSMEKDPDRRWQSAADLRDELAWAAETGTSTAAAPAPRPRRGSWLPWAAAGLLLATTAFLAWRLVANEAPRESFVIPTLPLPTDLANEPSRRFALSPDGEQLAYTARAADDRVMLWVRSLRTGAETMLQGTDGAAAPFWSPDSRSIGFSNRNRLMRIDLAERAGVREICQCVLPSSRAAWSAAGEIVFKSETAHALHRVSADGGTPSRLTSLDIEAGELTHDNPVWLPDQQHFLFVARGPNFSRVYIADRTGQRSAQLISDVMDVAYAREHVVFVRGTAAMAQRLDVSSHQLTGPVTTIASDVLAGSGARPGAALSVSEQGHMVYQSGTATRTRLEWFNRSGQPLGALSEYGDYNDLFLSPDGRHASVSSLETDSGRGIRVFDTETGLSQLLTTHAGDEYESPWSWDSKEIFFNRTINDRIDVYRKASNGAGGETTVLSSPSRKYPQGLSPDGRALLYMTFDEAGQDLWRYWMDAGRNEPLVTTSSNDGGGRYSKDGKWITYWSAGHVWIMPADGSGGPWQISRESGGAYPVWSDDQTEIFYATADALMVASVSCTDACQISAVRRLFEHPRTGRWHYAVMPDGQRFLLLRRSEATQGLLYFVSDWMARLAP